MQKANKQNTEGFIISCMENHFALTRSKSHFLVRACYFRIILASHPCEYGALVIGNSIVQTKRFMGCVTAVITMILALQRTCNVTSHDCMRPLCNVQTMENSAGDCLYNHGGVLDTGILSICLLCKRHQKSVYVWIYF